MPIHTKYYTGSTVSRYMSPDERSWLQVTYQSGRPILDSEQQLAQDVQTLLASVPAVSGFLPSHGQSSQSLLSDYLFLAPTDPGFVTNSFNLKKQRAIVAGLPVTLEYTEIATAGQNLIQLDSPPVLGGAAPDVKRTDFVFLEVWLAMVSFSPHATGTVTVAVGLPAVGNTITIAGLPLTAVAGAPGVDQFQIGGNEIVTAANIASAINNVANSFDLIVSADAAGTDTVTLRAVVAGAAGNAITLAKVGANLSVSGAFLAGGVDTDNKPTQSTIYRHGNVLAPSGVNLADDLADPVIDSETTKRIQIQYRIRVTGQTEAVNFKTQADGFTNTNVLAQGATGAPVATYPFVPADDSTVTGSSDATAYGIKNTGLWIAGSGSSLSASDLGTVDGFVYAIPICHAFRRNNAYAGGAGNGFDPLANSNGSIPSTHGPYVNPAVGAVGANLSDRPDGYFSDAIASDDILDLRKHITNKSDWAAELQYQMQALLDTKNHTWAIDAADKNTLGAGSGDVSTRFLVCNQIGRSTSHGGVAPGSGSTTRGDTIRDFDHVARRFGSQPVIERAVFEVYPNYTIISHPGRYNIPANVGYAGWAEDDEIHLDLTTLNATTLGDWDPATATYAGAGPHNASVDDFMPPGAVITNLLSVRQDDGSSTAAVNQNATLKLVTGLGTNHLVFTLDRNDDPVDAGGSVGVPYRMVGDSGTDDGSPRRIYVELEISYPAGVGTTDTPDTDILVPDNTVYLSGPVIENDTTQRPTDFELITNPQFREGYREIKQEYVANLVGSGIGSGTPITDSIVSASPIVLVFPRRVYGNAAYLPTVTDTLIAQIHNIDDTLTEYGSSSRVVTVSTAGGPAGSPLSAVGQTLCTITYFAQDAIPNYGAAGGGYQVGVYYRTPTKPTVGVHSGALAELPNTLTVEPLIMASNLWTGSVGKGSTDESFPFTSPLENIPVNDDGTSTYVGEWQFAATADISIGDFDASTGLLNLHTLVPGVMTDNLAFTTKARDTEFRAFYGFCDPAAYRPTVMAQPLSEVARHKVMTPFLARATADSVLYRKNEVLLLVLTRWAELDADNTIRFVDTDNRTCVGVYRTINMLVTVGAE